MPNPLMLAVTPPTTTAKTPSSLRSQPETEGTVSFQDILELNPAPIAETSDKATAQVPENATDIPESPNLIVDDQQVQTTQPEVANPVPQVDANIAAEPTAPHPIETSPFAAGPVAGAAEIRVRNIQDLPTTRHPGSQPLQVPVQTPAHTAAVNTSKPVVAVETPLNAVIKDTPDSHPRGTPAGMNDLAVSSIQPPPTSKSVQPHHGLTLTQLQLVSSAKTQETEFAAQVAETEGIVAVAEEPAPQLNRDVPTLTPASAIRPDMSRSIAAQLAAVVQSRPGPGAVEIALNPEELGRVSIVLNGREDGLHLTIAVERPETLDLMRRHIAVLTAEFQKMGYGDMSFDLGTPSDSQQDNEEQTSFTPAPEDNDSPSAPDLPRAVPGPGIDMRL